MRRERSGRSHYIDEDFGVKLVLVPFSDIPIFMFQCFYQKLENPKILHNYAKKIFNDNATSEISQPNCVRGGRRHPNVQQEPKEEFLYSPM